VGAEFNAGLVVPAECGMSMESHIYRFADLVLDVPNRRLTRQGVEVYLAPKTFDTLLVLVERHGQLVTKGALLDAVWNDTAVTDNALTQQISELRELLGDDARRPQFIRTVPRVGFTFIAPIDHAPPPVDGTNQLPHDQAPQEAAEPPPHRSWSRQAGVNRPGIHALRWATFATLAIGVAAGATWLATRSNTQFSRLELVSSLPGLHRSPTLSPDGRTVAFVSDRSGTLQVWVKALTGGNPLQLTFHEQPVARPRWSPQGDRIVYSVQGNGIWSVAPLGGSSRQLVEVGRNPDLAPDGRMLVFERPWEVWIANGDGTNQQRLPLLKQGYLAYYGDAWPTFSPSGKEIALFLGDKGPNGDYWAVPAVGGEPRRLTFDEAEGGAPAWTPDGKHIVVSSSRTGSLTLWRIPVAGGAPEALTTGAGDDLDPTISPDGQHVLFANVKRTWSLVIHNTHSGARRTVLETRTSLEFPRFSWDGRLIAFFGTNEIGDTQVFVVDSDGKNLRSVTAGKGELNVMPQWAYDGRSLFYYQVRPRPTFRRIPATGGPSREIAAWRWDREHEASSDPSSDRIVYSMLEAGRLRETRVRRLHNAQETTLAVPLFEPQFSPDGRLIAGESRDEAVTVCEIDGECRTLTPKLERGVSSIGWSADGKRVFYLQRIERAGWGELKSISVDGGTAQTYGVLGPLRPYGMSFGVSPHDEIVFAPYREGSHELWMAQLR
jgi:Tol biopolymer transport system component/DNA-binding winged helix-turn-helix (wHTH) protein